MRIIGAAVSVALALASASCAPAPPPPAQAPAPVVVRRAAPAQDWFQRELVSANTARKTHQPAGDKQGAQAAYDGIVHAACQRIAIDGPDKYKKRCDAILQPPANTPNAAPQNPFGCEADSDDEALRACND